MRIVGSSKTSAPSARSPPLSTPACCRVRVTTMRLPKSGRVSNQFSFSRSFTTSPKTATAGALKPAASTFAAMSPSVPRNVCCRPVVPQRTSATGIVFAAPCSISFAVIVPIRSTPISITFVPGVAASCAKSSELPVFAGSSCPVKMVSCAVWSRCVTGMPAYAGAASAEVTPGMISNRSPAAASASASSPPRPNKNGSPPFSRTTRFPARVFSTSSASISSCFSVCAPAFFPA